MSQRNVYPKNQSHFIFKDDLVELSAQKIPLVHKRLSRYNSPSMNTLKLALPKGSLEESTFALFKKAGFPLILPKKVQSEEECPVSSINSSLAVER